MTDNEQPLNPLPVYGEKPIRPGVYLGLLHGRDDPKQKMDEWGFNGPMIGPLKWVHTRGQRFGGCAGLADDGSNLH